MGTQKEESCRQTTRSPSRLFWKWRQHTPWSSVFFSSSALSPNHLLSIGSKKEMKREQSVDRRWTPTDSMETHSRAGLGIFTQQNGGCPCLATDSLCKSNHNVVPI